MVLRNSNLIRVKEELMPIFKRKNYVLNNNNLL